MILNLLHDWGLRVVDVHHSLSRVQSSPITVILFIFKFTDPLAQLTGF